MRVRGRSSGRTTIGTSRCRRRWTFSGSRLEDRIRTWPDPSGQLRTQAIDVSRDHAGRFEVALDSSPLLLQVVEDAQDSVWRAAELVTEGVTLVRFPPPIPNS